jgi:hypothetical protein
MATSSRFLIVGPMALQTETAFRHPSDHRPIVVDFLLN